MYDKNCNLCCCLYNIVAGLVFGIGIVGAFIAGAIISILPFVLVTIGVATLALIFILALYFCKSLKDVNKCLKNSCIISSIVGSYISSIIALIALPLVLPTAVFLLGVVAFFFITTLLNLIELFLCLKKTDHECCD